MSASVFISYDATADGEFARRLALGLRELDVHVWMAPDSIEAGESFPSAINRGLTSSSVFVLIVSPSALGSRWVRAETDAAIDLERKGALRIVPVVLRSTALPPLLSSYQSLPVTGDYRAFFDRFARSLGVAGDAITTGVRSGEVEKPVAATTPDGSFAALVLDGLRRDQDRHDFLVHAAPDERSSVLRGIVERELLRIGLAVLPTHDADEEESLLALREELRANPHRVVGVFAVQPADRTSMQLFRVTENGVEPLREADPDPRDPPRIACLHWRQRDDESALAGALAQFFTLLRGRPSLPELEMNEFVEAALSEIDRAASHMRARAWDPPSGTSSILRKVVERDGARIGIAVWARAETSVNTILAEMSRELMARPHSIGGLLGIHPGDTTRMQPYDLLRTGLVETQLLTWERRSGAGAIRSGLARVLDDFGGEPEHALDPVSASFHLGRADAFLELGAPEEAMAEADRALSLNPDLVDARGMRASALLALDRVAEALASAKEAVRLAPADVRCRILVAESLLRSQRAAEALAAADEALHLLPPPAPDSAASGSRDAGNADLDRVDAQCARADALLSLERHEECLSAVEEAIRLDPEHAVARTIKASALLDAGRVHEAIRAADEALALDPDSPAAAEVKSKAKSRLRRRRN